jgi:hypothetical protein
MSLGVFQEFRKATVTFVMFVRLSVRLSDRIEQLGLNWTNFREICYFSIFKKPVYETEVSLKSINNYGYITYRSTYVYDFISLHFS